MYPKTLKCQFHLIPKEHFWCFLKQAQNTLRTPTSNRLIFEDWISCSSYMLSKILKTFRCNNSSSEVFQKEHISNLIIFQIRGIWFHHRCSAYLVSCQFCQGGIEGRRVHWYWWSKILLLWEFFRIDLHIKLWIHLLRPWLNVQTWIRVLQYEQN